MSSNEWGSESNEEWSSDRIADMELDRQKDEEAEMFYRCVLKPNGLKFGDKLPFEEEVKKGEL